MKDMKKTKKLTRDDYLTANEQIKRNLREMLTPFSDYFIWSVLNAVENIK